MPEVKCIENIYSKRWVIKGTNILHRDDGPAVTEYYNNGNKRYEEWYQNGKFHRINGPARIWYDEYGNKELEEWYQNDKTHREDGPSHIWYTNGHIKGWEYRINDFAIDQKWIYENINDPLNPSPEEIALLRLTWC